MACKEHCKEYSASHTCTDVAKICSLRQHINIQIGQVSNSNLGLTTKSTVGGHSPVDLVIHSVEVAVTNGENVCRGWVGTYTAAVIRVLQRKTKHTQCGQTGQGLFTALPTPVCLMPIDNSLPTRQ